MAQFLLSWVGEIDRLSKSDSLSVLYKVTFDAMVIQKVGLEEIKYPSLLKASEFVVKG